MSEEPRSFERRRLDASISLTAQTTMDVSRRSFLGGALALTAATALPSAAFASAPVIYGDGQHDDTAGLQAAFDGKPFRVAGDGVYVVNNGGHVYLSGGTFRVSKTIHIHSAGVVTGGYFDAIDMPAGSGAVLHFHKLDPAKPLYIKDIVIDGRGNADCAIRISPSKEPQ